MIASENPDIVGFSCMTNTFNSTLNLAKEVKQKTKAINIFGGYHVSSIEERCVAKDIQSPIDYAVIGEGEETFRELVDCIKSGANAELVNGIAFRKGKQLVVNPRRSRIKNLDDLPWPLRSEEAFQRSSIHGYVGELPPSKQKSVAAVTYSRGCPYGCNFCPSQTIFGKTVSFRSPQDVAAEIGYLKECFGTNMVFLTDLTFNANREKALALSRVLENDALGVYWAAFYRPDSDRELLKAMKKANCMYIQIGIESSSDRVLRALQRPVSDEVFETISIANAEGLGVKGSLILGMDDTDDYQCIEEYIESYVSLLRTCARAGLDGIRLGFMTPFPGLACYDKYNHWGKLLTKDFSLFDNDHVIVRRKFNAEQLQYARRMIYQRFISSSERIKSLEEKARMFPGLSSSIEEL
jgi:anaerobic magnesium-protoporphyrin IX monomethyl ester cyclase